MQEKEQRKKPPDEKDGQYYIINPPAVALHARYDKHGVIRPVLDGLPHAERIIIGEQCRIPGQAGACLPSWSPEQIEFSEFQRA